MHRLALLALCLALAWPAAQDRVEPALQAAPPRQDTGIAVRFQLLCADCHGSDGSGTGPARAGLQPPPTDLVAAVYKLRSTPAGQLPTEEDILRVLRRGVAGTAMPGFDGILTQEQMLEMVAYVRSLSPRFAEEPPSAPFLVPPAPLSGPGGIANGEEAYVTLGCGSCHGPEGRGHVLVPNAQGQLVLSADLTAPWTFKNGSEYEDLFRVISTGIDGAAMPAYAGKTTEGERWELAFYIKSIGRAPVWVQSDAERVRNTPTGGIPDKVARGEYLVRALACGRCHTPMDANGTYDMTRALSGGTRVTVWPYGIYYSANLTADPDSGLGSHSEAEIARAITSGQAGFLGLRRLNPIAMPWPYYASLSQADAEAIAAYLLTTAPVYNAVPESDGFGFLATFSGQIETMFLGVPVTVEIIPASFGNAAPGGRPLVTPTARHRVAPVWAAGALVLVGLLFWGAYLVLVSLLKLRGPQARAARNAAIAVGVLAVLAGTAIYFSPLYRFLPGSMAAGQAVTMPPAVALKEPADQALAERGRYLATVSACGTCHSPAGAAPLAGGARTRWSLFGTAYSRNLTPHATGLAGWSDVDIKRAFRTGRARDGHAIHWQAMPWDFYSNWNEEDAQSIAFYLMNLVPQDHSTQLSSPPAPGDPEWSQSVLMDNKP